jgi:ATP-dependent DNA helicase PIF1
LPKGFAANLTKARREGIEAADVLIIDEISMLHDYRLDMINTALQKVRGNKEPFGGIQVILCGDFFQLPPVNRYDSQGGGFVVGSGSWAELEPVICYLGEQHRQDDDAFLDILNAMRANDLRRRHVELLLSRQDAHLEDEQNVTELHVTNVDVDAINNARLLQLEGDEHVYYAQTTGKENYIDALKRSCLALDKLVLKKGALVMCVRNSQDRKYR